MTDTNEAAVIGAVLKDPKVYDLVDYLQPEDFRWACYAWAWSGIRSLKEQGLSIDTITLGDELQRHNQLEDFQCAHNPNISGRMALSLLRDDGDPRKVESYAAIVNDHSGKRQLEAIGLELVNGAKNGRRAADLIADFHTKSGKIMLVDGRAKAHTKSMAEAVSEAYDYTDAASKGEIVCVPTGFKDLDALFGGGFESPDLIVIAGRPGQGKTAFLGSLAYNMSHPKKQGIPPKRIGFFTLEMLSRQIAMRFIAMESGVNYDTQKSGSLSPDEWPKYTHAVEKVSTLPIMLNDMSSISISQMRQSIRAMGGVDVVFVDYIQLATADGKYQNRELEVSAISRGLKAIAKEFLVPVVAAAQLSRAVEQRASGEAQLSDLRESGSIENDADAVVFIRRPDDSPNTASITVAKHRNGAVGKVELAYRPAITRFEDLYIPHPANDYVK